MGETYSMLFQEREKPLSISSMETEGLGDLNESTTLEDLQNSRQLRYRTHGRFRPANALANRIPNEMLVDILHFLNRDQLEKLQVTSGKFDIIVDKFFSVKPLRRVQICKVESRRNGHLKLEIACFSEENGRPQRIFESNTDLHLWLRNCHVETVRFNDFFFAEPILKSLELMNPASLVINHCIFDYERKTTVCRDPLATELKFRRLFAVSSFRNCRGVIFSFTRGAVRYRPSVGFLLALPLSTIVIDYEAHEISSDELNYVVEWLHDEPIQPPLSIQSCGDVMEVREQQSQPLTRSSSSSRTKTLSLRGVEFDTERFNNLVRKLRTRFLNETIERRAYLLETDFYPEVDIHENDEDYNEEGGGIGGAIAEKHVNMRTREQFEVRGDDYEPASIRRNRL